MWCGIGEAAMNTDLLSEPQNSGMRFIELFAGIGGFSLGLERAGMECVGQVEIDKAARGVLSAHWPHVPRFDDVRAFGRKAFDGPVDLIAGGFPCQDVSLAGRRAGLAGKRSGLWWQFRRVVRELRPRWVLVENVPGLLSSRGGQDFAVVVRGLVKCGYRVAWRTLDAQFFGLAQRRRRVFLVASFGSGRAVEVLFEPVGMPRDPAPRRKTWEEIAGALGSCSATGGRRATDLDGVGAYVAGALTNRVPTSDASCGSQGHILAHPDPAYAVSGSGSRFGSGRENQDTFVFSHQAGGDKKTRIVRAGDYAGALGVNKQDAVAGTFGVRRLTPLECERLQGFPEIKNSCTIEVWESCSDHQRNYALADVLSHKWPKHALSAENTETYLSVSSVEPSSRPKHQNDSKHAVVNVLINSEQTSLEVHSQGKLLWSANGADGPSTYPLPMPVGSFVRIVALIATTVGSETHNGRVALHPNTMLSIPPLSGKNIVALSGHEIVQRAKDVAQNTAKINSCIKCIISEAAPSSLSYAQALITLCCCVAHAIASSIPGLTLPTSSFSLNLTTISGWTAVNDQSDTARYRQLGNAVAVPVVEWIGRRLAAADREWQQVVAGSLAPTTDATTTGETDSQCNACGCCANGSVVEEC